MADAAAPPAGSESTPDRIYLVSYPKIVFLYPSLLASLAAGIYVSLTDIQRGQTDVASIVFLLVFAANLVVLSFDFPRGTSLTLFFCGVALVLGVRLLSVFKPNLLPAVGEFLSRLKPHANAAFYFIFAGVLGLIYLSVWINVHFDYWEVRPNELLHHHGILSDLERFAAPNLRIDKEINDVFEYVLLRAGRLILHPSQERRAIVLENVFFINTKEDQITRMLGAVQVQLRKEE